MTVYLILILALAIPQGDRYTPLLLILLRMTVLSCALEGTPESALTACQRHGFPGGNRKEGLLLQGTGSRFGLLSL